MGVKDADDKDDKKPAVEFLRAMLESQAELDEATRKGLQAMVGAAPPKAPDKPADALKETSARVAETQQKVTKLEKQKLKVDNQLAQAKQRLAQLEKESTELDQQYLAARADMDVAFRAHRQARGDVVFDAEGKGLGANTALPDSVEELQKMVQDLREVLLATTAAQTQLPRHKKARTGDEPGDEDMEADERVAREALEQEAKERKAQEVLAAAKAAAEGLRIAQGVPAG